MTCSIRLLPCLLLWALATSNVALAAPLNVAVAANFKHALQHVLDTSTQTLPATNLIMGSSGTLVAQISHGAPVDIFFSADIQRPQQLVRQGLALPESLQLYALGQLVVYTPQTLLGDWRDHVNQWAHIALPNPALAPYGEAAMKLLQSLPNSAQIEPRLVYGNNVQQAFQFVASGHAQAGFVALSLLRSHSDPLPGSSWRIDAQHYDPIRQAAVILKASNRIGDATALLAFVRSAPVQQRLQQLGYLPLKLSTP